MFMSFGFKNGVPEDADFVFDVRAIPNPHWQPDLRKLTGRDDEVVQWLAHQPIAAQLLADVRCFLERWLPEYQKHHRAYLTVASACTRVQPRRPYSVDPLVAASPSHSYNRQ